MSGWPTLSSLNIELKRSFAALGGLEGFHLNFDCNVFMRLMLPVTCGKTLIFPISHFYFKKGQNIIKQWFWGKKPKQWNSLPIMSPQDSSLSNIEMEQSWLEWGEEHRDLSGTSMGSPEPCLKIFAILHSYLCIKHYRTAQGGDIVRKELGKYILLLNSSECSFVIS